MGSGGSKDKFSTVWYQPDDSLGPLTLDSEHVRELVRRIEELVKDVPRVNILVLGPQGSGKTSFINTALAAYTGAAGGGGEANCVGSFTKTFHVACISEKITLCDFKGYDLDNKQFGYNNEILEAAINGQLRHGFRFDKPEQDMKNPEFFYPQPDVTEKIHCVLLLFPLNSPNVVFPKLRKHIEETYSIPGLTVFTRADAVVPPSQREDVLLDPSLIIKSETIKREVNRNAENFELCISVGQYAVMIPTRDTRIRNKEARNALVVRVFAWAVSLGVSGINQELQRARLYGGITSVHQKSNVMLM